MSSNVHQCASMSHNALRSMSFAEAASRVPACQLSIFYDDDVFRLKEEDVDEDDDEADEEPRPCMPIVQVMMFIIWKRRGC